MRDNKKLELAGSEYVTTQFAKLREKHETTFNNDIDRLVIKKKTRDNLTKHIHFYFCVQLSFKNT